MMFTEMPLWLIGLKTFAACAIGGGFVVGEVALDMKHGIEKGYKAAKDKDAETGNKLK